MINLTSAAIFFLAAGILTSVSVLSAFQILFAISVGFYTFRAIKDKAHQLPKSSYWLIGFVVIALISLIINFDLIPKPGKNFGRLKYYLYGIGGIFAMRVWLRDSSIRIRLFLSNVFLFSVILAGLVALYQIVIAGEVRAKALTDTMRYGYGSGMILLVLLGCLLHRHKIRDWFDPRLGLAAFLIGFLGMYVTYTRGGLLGFIVGLPVVIYFYRPKIAIGLGVIAVLVGSILSYFYLFGNVEPGKEIGF